jgi:hypothetical protein
MSQVQDPSALDDVDAIGGMQGSRNASEPRPQASKRGITPSRVGAKPIAGFFPQEVRIQLKALASSFNRSMESMLGEAIDDLFAKYGEARIANDARGR